MKRIGQAVGARIGTAVPMRAMLMPLGLGTKECQEMIGVRDAAAGSAAVPLYRDPDPYFAVLNFGKAGI